MEEGGGVGFMGRAEESRATDRVSVAALSTLLARFVVAVSCVRRCSVSPFSSIQSM